MADPRLDHHPGAPLRRRRPQKWDGTGGQSEQALGRSRGGFGTKIHGAVSGLGLPARLILTPGQAADMSHAKALIEGLPIEVVIADKGYDSRAVVEAVEARGAEAVIPSLKNRAERFWFKVKQYRRVATRYEKTARNFLAFVHVASIMILLQ